MKTSILAGSALALSAIAVPVQAQLVSADVLVRSGLVHGHIIVNDRPAYHHRPVVYERPARVIVVERHRGRGHGRFKHWKRHGYRQIVVYHVDGRYYDRYDRRRPGVREVVVYERDGRYYRSYDDYERRDRRDDYRERDRDRHRDRDHRYDRWGD